MNIFVTHKNPKDCALFLDNVRLNKMIIETGQIISTVLRTQYHDNNPILYKKAFIYHPCVKWVQEKPEHLVWLIHLFFEYTHEYTRRFRKIHKTQRTLGSYFKSVLKYFPAFTTRIHFYNGSLYKNIPLFKAYRLTLYKKWEQDRLKGRPPKFN